MAEPNTRREGKVCLRRINRHQNDARLIQEFVQIPDRPRPVAVAPSCQHCARLDIIGDRHQSLGKLCETCAQRRGGRFAEQHRHYRRGVDDEARRRPSVIPGRRTPHPTLPG